MRRRFLLLSLLIPATAVAQLKPGDFVTGGPTTAKRIALTFDDGPGPNTVKFLALLRKYNVKATFFMLGDQARQRPAIARQVAEEGHEIGNHTMTHINYAARYKYRLSQTAGSKEKAVELVKADLLADMRQSRQILEKETGAKLRILRMPHGIDKPWIKETARDAGFILANWTYGADWTSPPPNPVEELKKSYVHALRPGVIFLIHDGWPKSDKSLSVTEAVIKAAQANGYEIVTLGELIGLDSEKR